MGAWLRQPQRVLLAAGRADVHLARGGRSPLQTGRNAEPVWEPISDFEGRYYEDLVDNPGETPEEFLAKVGGGDELPPGLLPAVPAGARRAGWPMRTAQRAPGPRGQMLEEADWDGPKQVFTLPDLEQETDGLDLLQDFAPGARGASGTASQAPPAAAARRRGAQQGEDEGYAMHSLRNAFEAKALPAAQSLYQQPPARRAVPAGRPVAPTADDIDTFLQALLLRAQDRHGAAPVGAVDAHVLTRLRSTVENLQQVALRDPQARRLIARRLSQLAARTARAQTLRDYDSVYLAPYVDDLDDYLQGILDEVNRTEIPAMEDEDKAVDVATQTLRAADVLHDPEVRVCVLCAVCCVCVCVVWLCVFDMYIHTAHIYI